MSVPNEAELSAQNVTASPDIPIVRQTFSNINLEDCVCSICMDYYINAVETECHHRFCNYCLNRWINFNPNRKCPTCRRNIGLISNLPQLDTSVSNAVRTTLGEEEVQQRDAVRTQRATSEPFAIPDFNFPENDEGWTRQASALISRIRETRDRIREFQAEQGLRNQEDRERLAARRRARSARRRRTTNPTNTTPEFVQPEIFPDFRSRSNLPRSNQQQSRSEFTERELIENRTVSSNEFPLRQHLAQREQSRSGLTQMHFDFDEVPTNRSNRIRSNQPMQQQSPRQNNLQNEDEIVSEYSYHLRQAESAYTRIKDAHREFNFHNHHLNQLFNEFATSRENHQTDSNDDLYYEDYETLRQAEMREIRRERGSTLTKLSSGVRFPETDLVRSFDSTLQTVTHQLNSMRRLRREDAFRNGQFVAGADVGQRFSGSRGIPQRSPLSHFEYESSGRERRQDHINLVTYEDFGNRRDSISGAFPSRMHRIYPNVRESREHVNLQSFEPIPGIIMQLPITHRRSLSFDENEIFMRPREIAIDELDPNFDSNRSQNITPRNRDEVPDRCTTRPDDSTTYNLPFFSRDIPERNSIPERDSPSENGTEATMQADEDAIRESLREIINLDAMLQTEVPVRDNDITDSASTPEDNLIDANGNLQEPMNAT